MKKEKNTKGKVINIRLSPTENEKLRIMASSKEMNVSSFIREKTLSDENALYDDIPRQIDSWNFANEIFHEAKKCSDIKCQDNLLKILKKYATTQAEVTR